MEANKTEYFSLLAKKSSNSRKKLGIQTNKIRNQLDSQSMRVQDISTDDRNDVEILEKSKQEIAALEKLHLMNAWARMKLINANKAASSNNNKSVDFSLSFKQDFNMWGKKSRKGVSITRQNHRPKHNELANQVLQAQYSFSNILQDNPATLIKQ